MTHMMQSMRRCLLECCKLNALPILLTLILYDRFPMIFGITVDPLDSIITSSSIDSDDDRSSEFASEIHDLNQIDYNQFINGYNKYFGSQEIVSKCNFIQRKIFRGILFNIIK